MSSSNFPVKFNDVDSDYDERQCSPTNVGKESTQNISNPLLESFMFQSQYDLEKFDFDYDKKLKAVECVNETNDIAHDTQLTIETSATPSNHINVQSETKTPRISTASSNNTVFNAQNIDHENNKENTSPDDRSERDSKVSNQTSPRPQAQSFTVSFNSDDKPITSMPPRLIKQAKLYEQKREEKLAASLAKTQEQIKLINVPVKRQTYAPVKPANNIPLRNRITSKSTKEISTTSTTKSSVSNPPSKAPFRAGGVTSTALNNPSCKVPQRYVPSKNSTKTNTLPKNDTLPKSNVGKAPETNTVTEKKFGFYQRSLSSSKLSTKNKTAVDIKKYTSSSNVNKPTMASSNRRLTNPNLSTAFRTANPQSTQPSISKFPRPKPGGEREPLKSSAVSNPKSSIELRKSLKKSQETTSSLKFVDIFLEKFNKYSSIKDYLMDKMFEELEKPDSMFEVIEKTVDDECSVVSEDNSNDKKPPLPKKHAQNPPQQNLRFDELKDLAIDNVNHNHLLNQAKNPNPVDLSASMASLAVSYTGTYNLENDNTLAAKGHIPIVVDPKKSLEALTQLSELKEAKKKFCDSRNNANTNVRQSITALSQILHKKSSPTNQSVNDSLRTNLPSTVTEIALTPGTRLPSSMFGVEKIHTSMTTSDSVFRSYDMNDLTLQNEEHFVSDSNEITTDLFRQLPKVGNKSCIDLRQNNETKHQIDKRTEDFTSKTDNDLENERCSRTEYVDLKDAKNSFESYEDVVMRKSFLSSNDQNFQNYGRRRESQMRLPTSWISEEYSCHDANENQDSSHQNYKENGTAVSNNLDNKSPEKSKSEDDDDDSELIADYPNQLKLLPHDKISANLYMSQLNGHFNMNSTGVSRNSQHLQQQQQQLPQTCNNNIMPTTPSSSSSGNKKSSNFKFVQQTSSGDNFSYHEYFSTPPATNTTSANPRTQHAIANSYYEKFGSIEDGLSHERLLDSLDRINQPKNIMNTSFQNKVIHHHQHQMPQQPYSNGNTSDDVIPVSIRSTSHRSSSAVSTKQRPRSAFFQNESFNERMRDLRTTTISYNQYQNNIDTCYYPQVCQGSPRVMPKQSPSHNSSMNRQKSLSISRRSTTNSTTNNAISNQNNKSLKSSNRPNSLVGSAFSIPNYNETSSQRNNNTTTSIHQYQSKTPLESPRRFNYPSQLMKRKLSTSAINEQGLMRPQKNENNSLTSKIPSRLSRVVSNSSGTATGNEADQVYSQMSSSGGSNEDDTHISLSQLANEINRVNKSLLQRIEKSRQNSLYDVSLDSEMGSTTNPRISIRNRNKSESVNGDYSNRSSSLTRSDTRSSAQHHELKEVLRLMQNAAYSLNSASKLFQSQDLTPPSSTDQTNLSTSNETQNGP